MAYFEDNVVWMMDKFISDFDADKLDASAVFGNAGHESAGFQSLQELKPLVKGSRGGFGIMQWTGPRRREYEAYCERSGKDPVSMQTNYDFLFVELSGPEGKVLQKLKAAKTLDEKTEVFSKVFLRPGIPHLDSRKLWALKALKAYEKAKKDNSKDVSVVVPKDEPKVVKKDEPKIETKKSLLSLIFELIWKIVRSR